MEPGELRRVALRVAGETAALLRDYMCDEGLSRVLEGETTLADKMAEDYAIDVLRSEGIRAFIVSEELGVTGSGDIVALIDPLDGSKNYLACIPWAAVSIAFAKPRANSVSDVLAGAVAPVNRLPPFSFEKGGGCYHGGVRVTDRRSGIAEIVNVYVEHEEAVYKLAKLVRSWRRGVKIRSLGSASLELSYVALGTFTAFIDIRSKLRNIDIAAAAGGIVECNGFIASEDGGKIPFHADGVHRIGNIVAARDKDTGLAIIKALRD
ncbi:MAG: hypothetical protein GSR85_01195 [Desulfurococcales archaeon]|nr:hypothetical protein [Desulfurococcales archaeon]